MTEYDLIVIGGGPSGSSAARAAAKMGLSTLLIDKKDFPKYKPCGGALSEQAISYLDFELPPDLIEKKINGARVGYKEHIITRKKDYPIAVIISRSPFDHYLLKKAAEAGAEIKTGLKVTGVEEEPDSVVVKTTDGEYASKYAIIAEGSQGKLAKSVRKPDPKKHYGICMVTEIPADDEDIDKQYDAFIDVYFDVANGGYGWIFPHKGYYSVGIGGLADKIENPRELLAAFLKRFSFDDNAAYKGHTIPAGGITRKVTGDRIILAGDAAGFVDPFYGEGLAYAIRSGQLAAETVDGILKNKGINLSDYKKRCNKEFGKNLYYSLLLSRLMHKMPNTLFTLFTTKGNLLEKYLEVPALKRTYKSYLLWLLPRLPFYLTQQLFKK